MGLTRTRDKSYWESKNLILRQGEVGFEGENGRSKLGDGHTAWNDLPYTSYSSFLIPQESTTFESDASQQITEAHDTDVEREQFVPARLSDAALRAALVPGYLLACFRGNTAERQTLNVYYSGDGKSFADHGRNPVWKPTDGSVVRDPSIIYLDGWFYAAYTRTAATGASWDIARSSDLLSWSKVATVDVSSIGGVNGTWAPELVQDDNGDIYCFISINAMTIYRQKATATDLSTWSAPTLVTITGGPAQTIDPAFIKHDDTWYMFYKNEVTGQKVIERATSSSLSGAWTTDRNGNWAGWGVDVEGPTLVELPDGGFRIYLDNYGAGTGLAYSDSTDLNTWSTLTTVEVRPALTPGLGTLRHGTVIRLSDSQALAVTIALSMTYPSHSADPGVPNIQSVTPGVYTGVDGLGRGVVALVDENGVNWRIDLDVQNGQPVMRIVKAGNSVPVQIPLSSGSAANLFTLPTGMSFRPNASTTAPAAGGAGALPATPAGYMEMTVNGTVRKVPYY
jgi:hypothetical protein